jgi:transcriptional regulator with XRE-family HTH domain
MNHTDLGILIKQKREREGLSLRRAASQCGVSYSVLSQLENGGRHYLYGKTLSRLTTWLGASYYFPQKPLPEIVDDLLLLDLSLSEDAAMTLMGIFRNAYEAMTA